MHAEQTAELPIEGGRRGRRRALWIVFSLAIAVIAGFFVVSNARGSQPGKAAAAQEEGKEKKAPVPVSVEAVAAGAISSYLSATANLVADNEVKVLAEEEGRVARLLVDEGDWVERGQTLATLAREDAEIALAKMRVKAQNAGSVHERGQRMLQEGLISQEAYDRLRMEHDMARQEIAEAEHRLSKAAIHAPFSGRITSRIVDQGQNVRYGEELFTLADFEPLIAYLYLPEKEVLGLRAGREARITLKADESVGFRGRIRQISPVVDTATGTVKVTVEAVPPLPEAVRPGGFVTVRIVREQRPGALLVPRQAVLRELQSAHVFVAKNGAAEKRPVELGLEEGGRVEVLSGVTQGETVIVAGQGSLKHGAAVKVIAGHGAVKTAEQRAEEARSR